MELARIGSAAFNAVTSALSRAIDVSPQTEALPPLALQVFLPLFFRALKPSPTSTFASPFSTPVSSPVSSPRNRTEAPTTPRSLRSAVNLTRQMGRLVTLTRQGSGIDADGAPSPAMMLSRLLRLLDPLISTESEWYQFLTRLYLALEESRDGPVELKQLGATVADSRVADDEATLDTVNEDADSIETVAEGLASMRSVLTAARIQKMRRATDGSAIKHALGRLDVGTTGCERVHMAATILSCCLGQRAVTNHKENALVTRLANDLASVPTRVGGIQVGLCVLPELVPLLCEKALRFYGDTSSASTMDVSNRLEATESWLTALQSFPETTGTVLLTIDAFGSFSFLRNVFFGALSSLELRLAVLKHVARQGGAASTCESMAKPYQLPRSVIIAPESANSPDRDDYRIPQLSTPYHLLLTLDRFQEVLDLEKKHIDALETMPMALINMSSTVQRPESWDQLFRILYWSFARATSVTHARSLATKHTHPEANSAGAGRGVTSSAPLARLKSQNQTQARAPSSPTSPRLTAQKSSRLHRRESSSRSVMLRESDAALVTPSYPRILAVVATPGAVPRHLRKSVVCFRTGKRRVFGHCDGGSGSSLQCHLQAAILRIIYYPFEAMLSAASKSDESYKPGEDTAAEPSQPPTSAWPPELGGLLAAIAVFHAILSFRHEESVAVAESGGGLPQCSDDALTTSVSQVALTTQEVTRRTDKGPDNGLED